MHQTTILLAEDDAVHVSLICQALKIIDDTWQVELVRDGVEVLDYLFAMGAHATRDVYQLPQLILLDLAMPKMGGMQVLQVLRRVRGGDRTRLPPIVMLTATQDEIDLIHQQNLGPFTSIHKTVEFNDLVSELRRTTLHWLSWFEPSVFSSSAASNLGGA